MTEAAPTQNMPFGPQRSPLARELARKSFHMLSLVYLAAYKLIGWPRVMPIMHAWVAFAFLVETARLRSAWLNRTLTSFFGGLAREDEHDKYSGIIHTTLGVWFLWLFFGAHPRVVSAAIYYVAFGDASAALVGKAFGRHRIGTSRKSVEGSGACFAACLLVGLAHRVPPGPAFVAAATATVVEFLPTTRWWNDNLWMPVVTATVLRLCAVS